VRWPSFLLLAVLGIAFQTVIAPSLEINHIRPDWMFVLAVHYALHAPWADGLLAAWVLGLLVDLSTQERLGLFAFSYGLAALGIVQIRDLVFRDHPLTHVVVTLVFGGVAQAVIGIYRWVVHGSPTSPGPSIAWDALFTALYTAAWAPYMHWALLKCRRFLGLVQPRRVGRARR